MSVIGGFSIFMDNHLAFCRYAGYNSFDYDQKGWEEYDT